MEYGAHRFVLHGYLFYTVTRHAMHHWHALHHRRGEWPACYGVTTSFWERLFGSVQTMPFDTGRTRCVVNRTDPDGPFV